MKRRLIFMRSQHSRWPRVLSVMVLATVLMCQVLGALCPSVLPALDAAETILSAHAMHEMEGMNMCRDSIPSSFASFKSLETSPVWLPDSAPSALHGLQAAGIIHPVGPLVAVKGHSIFSRLSTFRI